MVDKNAFASPVHDEAGQFGSEGERFEHEGAVDLIIDSIAPLNKAVPWLRIISIICILLSVIVIFMMLMGSNPNFLIAVLGFVVWAGLVTSSGANCIRRGTVSSTVSIIHLGMKRLKMAAILWALILIVLFLLAMVGLSAAGRF